MLTATPTTTEPLGDVTETTVAVVAQGAKQTALNGRTFKRAVLME